MRTEVGIWPVRVEAEKLGEVLAQRLGGVLFRPWREAGLEEAQSRQAVSQLDVFREQFGQRSQWVLVMATGIAVRFVAGMLRDKHQDPAVVVLDEAGRHAIALVGGHEGGANALAYRVAHAVGAIPVVTTATEAVKPLVVGIGCRKDVNEEQIERAVRYALAGGAMGGPGDMGDLATAVGDLAAIREIVTVDLKAGEPGLIAFGQRHGIPLRIITKQQIEARPWVSKPSEWVRQSVGLDGVCEPCALIASTRGRLVVPKTTLDGVAVAIVADEWGFGS